MGESDLLSRLRAQVTLEPAIFVYVFSTFAAFGGGQSTKLLLWKVCNVIKRYNETVCSDLRDPANEEAENAVQIFANDFAIKDGLLQSAPSMIYVFFAGALSDHLGRKYLITLPIVGQFISTVFMIVHYYFIWELPMEMFYLDNWHAYMGSSAMYYMGIYAYAADVSSPAGRAQRLARYDGAEMVGALLGTFVSPYLFSSTGYYGIYATRLVLVGAALAYWFRFVKSPKELEELRRKKRKEEEEEGDGEDAEALEKKEEEEGDEKRNGKAEEEENDEAKVKVEEKSSFFVKYVVTPLKEFYATMTKSRPRGLRALLYVNFCIYFLYITTFSYNTDKYLYMAKAFDDFNTAKYAYLGVAERIVSCLSLFALMPLLLTKLKWHETSVQILICVLQVISLSCAAFAQKLFPEFSVAMAASSVDACVWALVRSVFTKIVDKDEVGKVFSMVALLAASTPLISRPMFKKFYNFTLATFPSAFLLLGASMFALALALNAVMYRFRGRYVAAPKDAAPEAAVEADENHKSESPL